jgi:hypothetical protein
MALFVFFKRGKRLNKFFRNYLLVFFLLIVGQLIIFSFFPTFAFFGYLLRIILAFCVIKITGKAFVDYYIKILYFFSLVSFFFFIPTVISHDFEYFFTSHITPFFNLSSDPLNMYISTPNIIIFNFNSGLHDPGGQYIRNSGPFWEPGAFAGFIIIALIFNIIKTRKLLNIINFVFIITIITTFSTTGYIALFLVTIFYYLQQVKSVIKYYILPLIVYVSFYAFYNLEFLNSKIEDSIQTISTSSTSNRFVSALTDIKDLKKYWLLGRGFNVETRYDKLALLMRETHRNNGITALMAQIGLIAAILYFYLIFKFFKRFCMANGFTPFFAYSSIIVVLTIGFSEGYFTRVVFIALTMLFILFDEHVLKTKGPI